MDDLRRQMAELRAEGDPRADAPVVRAYHVSRRDEAKRHPLQLLRNIPLDASTEFSVAWQRDELVFDVRCEEPDMTDIRTPEDVWEGAVQIGIGIEIGVARPGSSITIAIPMAMRPGAPDALIIPKISTLVQIRRHFILIARTDMIIQTVAVMIYAVLAVNRDLCCS